MSFFCPFYFGTSLTPAYQSLCRKFQIKAYMNGPRLLRKGMDSGRKLLWGSEWGSSSSWLCKCRLTENRALDKWFLNPIGGSQKRCLLRHSCPLLASCKWTIFPFFSLPLRMVIAEPCPLSWMSQRAISSLQPRMICCNTSPPTWRFSLSQTGCGRVGHNTVLNNSYNEKYDTFFPGIILLCLDTNVEQRTFNFYLIVVLDQGLT